MGIQAKRSMVCKYILVFVPPTEIQFYRLLWIGTRTESLADMRSIGDDCERENDNVYIQWSQFYLSVRADERKMTKINLVVSALKGKKAFLLTFCSTYFRYSSISFRSVESSRSNINKNIRLPQKRDRGLALSCKRESALHLSSRQFGFFSVAD